MFIIQYNNVIVLLLSKLDGIAESLKESVVQASDALAENFKQEIENTISGNPNAKSVVASVQMQENDLYTSISVSAFTQNIGQCKHYISKADKQVPIVRNDDDTADYSIAEQRIVNSLSEAVFQPMATLA